MSREDMLAFWFGEPDTPTPTYIREAGISAIRQGQTRYVQTLGMPALRERLSAYLSELHGQPIAVNRIAVTASGTSSLMMAMQAILGKGDRVVAVTPVWPNLIEMPKMLGAEVVSVAQTFTASGWGLDIPALLAALSPGTKALLINAPNNPTGFSLTRSEQLQVLAHCRKHGIWIISDDVYQRLFYGARSAPSFLDIAEEGDRLISCNSFSKAWSMTGWRLGWMVGPGSVMPEVSKLIEINTTCSPGFVQLAGLAALEHGEADVQACVSRLQQSRDYLAERLSAIPGVTVGPPPPGAMYSLFRVDGVDDSLTFCKQLAISHGLGLAPGIAFGEQAEGYLRWCYASSIDRLDAGVSRLRRGLSAM